MYDTTGQEYSSYGSSDAKSDFDKNFEPHKKKYNKQINDLILVAYDCRLRIKALEERVSMTRTTFCLVLPKTETYTDFSKVKEIFKRFNVREHPECENKSLYEMNEIYYFIDVCSLDELALLQQKLDSKLRIDYTEKIPVIIPEDDFEDDWE